MSSPGICMSLSYPDLFKKQTDKHQHNTLQNESTTFLPLLKSAGALLENRGDLGNNVIKEEEPRTGCCCD